MVSRKLMGVWIALDFLLLAAGAITLGLSIAWRVPNVLLNLVFDNGDLTGGIILGVALLATFAFSVGAVIQRNHITIGLVILNWVLVVDALGILIVGTFVWYFTLMERNNYRKAFLAQSVDTQIAIQDKLQCCGYFNTSDVVTFGGLCQNAGFAVSHNVTCVTPITAFADSTLNDVFTTVYGFMAIVLSLFLATLCVIKKRKEDERFRRIDEKRGGRGFV